MRLMRDFSSSWLYFLLCHNFPRSYCRSRLRDDFRTSESGYVCNSGRLPNAPCCLDGRDQLEPSLSALSRRMMLAPIPAGRARDHFTRTNISLSYSAIGLRDRGWQMLRRLTKMKRKSLRGSLCPVARALDVIGDWWSLLIIYEVIAGPKRFGELQRNLGVTKNTLATNEDDFNRRIDAPG